MHTALTAALLFCLVAAYASALPADPVKNDNVNVAAPVAAIEGEEVLQGEEARWRHGGYRDGYRGGGGYRGDGGYRGGGGWYRGGGRGWKRG